LIYIKHIVVYVYLLLRKVFKLFAKLEKKK